MFCLTLKSFLTVLSDVDGGGIGGRRQHGQETHHHGSAYNNESLRHFCWYVAGNISQFKLASVDLALLP